MLCPRPLALALLLAVSASASTAQFLQPSVEVLYELHGEADGDNFGILCEAIGDLNGDRVQEFVVTAPYNDEGAKDAGKAYLYDGRSGILIRSHVNTLAGGNLQRAGAAGDLDGDGVLDYIVAAWPNNAGVGSGQVWAYSGETGALIQFFKGQRMNDEFGHDVAGMADIDGDGWGEIVVGASLFDGPGGASNAGRVYVLSAKDGTLHYTIDGPRAQSTFGHSLTSVPDLDGDGFEDLIIGAPEGATSSFTGSGKGYVHSGRTGALLRVLTPTTGRAAVFGGWISSPRVDLTGDGIPDALMTDQGDFSRGQETGRIYAFDGATGAPLWNRRGSSALQGFGASDNIGDVTADGIDDLVISSWRSPDGGAAFTGKVDVWDGATGTRLRTITPTDPGGAFGGKPCGIGDVDCDGLPDLLVNSPLSSERGPGRGKLVVIRGQDHRPACLTLSVSAQPLAGQAVTFTLSGGTPGEPAEMVGQVRGGRDCNLFAVVTDRVRFFRRVGTFDAAGDFMAEWTPRPMSTGVSVRFFGSMATAPDVAPCRSQFLDRVVK